MLWSELLKSLVENSLSGFYVVGKRGTVFYYVNRTMADIFGYKPEEMVGKLGPMDIVHPEHREMVKRIIKRRIGGKERFVRYKFKGLRKDGVPIWCEVYGAIAAPVGGELVIAGTLVDITDKVETQEELEKKERFYRSIFEGVSDAILIIDGYTFIDCNAKSLEMFGCKEKEEIVGHTPYDFSPPIQPDGTPSREKGMVFLKKALSGSPQSFYWRYLRKDGTPFDAEVSLDSVKVGEDTLVRVVIKDITQRLRLERELRKKEELYRSLVELSGVGIVVLDGKGYIRFTNKMFIKMSGYTPLELKGRSFLSLVHRKDVQKVSKALESPPENLKFEIKRKKGGYIIVSASVATIREDGEVLYNLYITDITKEEHLRNRILITQKMESLGRLTGGIAHHFNNILTIIMGNCELIKKNLENPSFVAKRVEGIEKASEKASNLVKQLLAFSKRQEMEPILMDINVLINNLKHIISAILGGRIAFELDLSDQPVEAKVDPSHLEQAIINLVINAEESMPKGGKLTIKTFYTTIYEEDQEVAPGDYAVVSISDTGKGMDEEMKSRVFEPFFSTKEGGVGLGLSAVYGMVEQMGGRIVCYSEPGKGTTFELFFPRAKKAEKVLLPSSKT